MKKESDYQKEVIDKIKILFPGCDITKNDPKYLQGFPDFSIHYGPKSALLEFKRSEHERHQPNQDYYVNKRNEQGGFARFIYPENEAAVLSDLILFFKGETHEI